MDLTFIERKLLCTVILWEIYFIPGESSIPSRILLRQNIMPIFITAPGVPDIGINWRAFISDSARQPLMSFNEPFRAGNPRQLEPHELRLINLPDLLQVPIGCFKEEEGATETTRIPSRPDWNMHKVKSTAESKDFNVATEEDSQK